VICRIDIVAPTTALEPSAPETIIEAMKRLILHGFVTKHRRSKLIGNRGRGGCRTPMPMKSTCQTKDWRTCRSLPVAKYLAARGLVEIVGGDLMRPLGAREGELFG
jgi:hypothetical protein